MSDLIAVANLAGLIVFATLLWPSRARIVGIVAFALPLVPFALSLMRPKGPLSIDSPWYQVARLGTVLTLASDVLLLGAVYALRPNASSESAERERRILNIVSLILIAGLAFASLFERWTYSAEQAASFVILLLAVSATLIRWGKTPVGLTGAAGFGVLAVVALLASLNRFLSEGGQPWVSNDISRWLLLLGLGAVVGSFALAAQDSAIQQKPYPGVETNGMNSPRCVGLALVVVGALVFLGLSYAITHEGILKGLRGKAALMGALLPGAGLYLVLVGAARLTTGRAIWARKDF